MVIIKNKYFILILLLLLFVLFVTGCDKELEDSKKYIVTVTVKNVDIDTGEHIRTATTKTENGKQGSTSNGVTTFSLEGNKEYTFISTAPYYNESKKKVSVGKENILITIEMSKVKSKITGHIVDSQGNNVKEAIVELTDLGKKTESDENGKFVFENIPSSGDKTYTINIEKTGYGKRIVSNVKVVGNDTVDLGKIVLSSNPGIISGKVTDINGAELNNINVNVVELGRSARTDYSGSFNISVPPGTYTVRFTHSNFDDVEEVVTVESDENKFINIKMQPKPGSISGIVLDNYGQPVYGVQISILGMNKTVETLSNGHFVFEDIPPGNYTLEFSHSSFRVFNQKVSVKSNQETVMGNIMLQEKTGMLTGRVLEKESGNSISNANVKVRETGEYVSTNSEGYFTFSNIRVGEYTLDITAISYSSAVINNVVIKENSVTTIDDVWLIKDPATLIGTVKDSVSDKPLSRVLVLINELDLRAETDDNGSFRFEGVKAGSYSITLIYDNYYQRNINKVYLGPNDTLNLGTIKLDPVPGKITGITTPGAEVRITETGRRLTVNDTGSFILQDIQPGNYTLNITLKDYYAKSIEIKVYPGELLELGDVSLEPMPGRIIGSSNADIITILNTGEIYENTAESFSFNNIEPGEYRLLFEKEDHFSREIRVDVGPNQVVDLGKISLEPHHGSISGYLNSKYNVVLLQKGEVLRKSGYFEFTDLPTGSYTVKVESEGYHFKIYDVEINPGDHIDLGSINLTRLPDLEQYTETVTVHFFNNTMYFDVLFPQTIKWYIYAWGETTWGIGGRDTQPGIGEIRDPDGVIVVQVWQEGDGEKSESGTFTASKIGRWKVFTAAWGDEEGARGWVNYQVDKGKPFINFSNTYGYGQSSYTVYIDAIDEHSGIAKVEYCISDSQNQEDLLNEITNGSFLTINNRGRWFLHVKATDLAGNERYQVEGPFIIE